MALLEIVGESFRPDLTAWFGDIEAVTVYRSETSLACTIPDASLFKTTNSMFGLDSSNGKNASQHHHNHHSLMVSQPLQVPVNLVRSDGIIYNTGFNFTYTPEPVVLSSSASASAAVNQSSPNQMSVLNSSTSMYS